MNGTNFELVDFEEKRVKWTFKRFLQDFSQLLPYVKEFKLRLIICFSLFIVSLMATLYLPKVMAQVIDVGLSKKDQFFSLFMIFALIYFIKISSEFIQKYLFLSVGEGASRNIRKDIFEILLRVPIQFFDRNASGKIISRSVNDVTSIGPILSPKFFTTFSELSTVVGAIVMLYTQNIKIALIITVFILALGLVLYKYLTSLSFMMLRSRSFNSRLNAYVGDTMNGLEVIYAGDYKRFWLPRFKKLTRLYEMACEKSVYAWAKFPVTWTLTLGASYLSVVLISMQLMDEKLITTGVFVSLLTYITLIFNPFLELAQKISEYQSAFSSLHKIKQILNLKKTIDPENEFRSESDWRSGDITFSQVCFSYDKNKILFKDFNLSFKQGSKTALIGKTGSGKSSMVGLICRLYEIQAGVIAVGGIDTKKISKGKISEKVGVVSQQLFLFEDTLRENLRLYNQNISDEQIMDVLKRVEIWSKIEVLPKKLDTYYERNNDNFSMGERQLLMVARMLLKNPEILIFDEATASLDNYTEYQVQKALEILFQGRTTIVIAHRLSTIQICDTVVVLEKGQVVEQGPREELEFSGGAYTNYLSFLKNESTDIQTFN